MGKLYVVGFGPGGCYANYFMLSRNLSKKLLRFS